MTRKMAAVPVAGCRAEAAPRAAPRAEPLVARRRVAQPLAVLQRAVLRLVETAVVVRGRVALLVEVPPTPVAA